MSKLTGGIVGVVALVAILGGAYAFMGKKDAGTIVQEKTMVKEVIVNSGAMMEKKDEGTPVNSGAMMEKKDEGTPVNSGAMMEKKDEGTPVNSGAMMEKKDADLPVNAGAMMEKKPDAMMPKDGAMMEKKGSYEAYSPEKVMRAETGDVVLFFHASWCPSCRGLNADIEKNLGSITGGVSILKVDYDTETELKKKYGVTYQHTLVQVDKDGNLIKKWSGSPSLDRLLSEIQ